LLSVLLPDRIEDQQAQRRTSQVCFCHLGIAVYLATTIFVTCISLQYCASNTKRRVNLGGHKTPGDENSRTCGKRDHFTHFQICVLQRCVAILQWCVQSKLFIEEVFCSNGIEIKPWGHSTGQNLWHLLIMQNFI